MLGDEAKTSTAGYVAAHRKERTMMVHGHYTNSVYAATACSVPPQAFAHICWLYRFAILYS